MRDITILTKSAFAMVRLRNNQLPAPDEPHRVRDGMQHRVETLGDRLDATRQVDDETLPTNTCTSPAEDRCGHLGDTGRAHRLAEARQHLGARGGGRLGRHVARRGAGAARRQDEGVGCGEALDGGGDGREVVRDEEGRRRGWTSEVSRDVGEDGWAAEVGVGTRVGAVGDC